MTEPIFLQQLQLNFTFTKDFGHFMMFWEMTVDQLEELITNIRFHNFWKWWIKPYCFALAFFDLCVLIFVVSVILMVY